MPLLLLYLVKLLIDRLSQVLSGNTVDINEIQVVWVVIALGGVSLFQSALAHIANYYNQVFSERMVDQVQDIIHSKSITLDVEYYENSSYYNILHLVQQEGRHRVAHLTRIYSNLVLNTVTLLSMSVALLVVSKHVGWILLLASFPALWVRFKFAGINHKWKNDVAETERQGEYLNWLLISPWYAADIRMLGLGNYFKTAYQDVRKKIRTARLYIAWKRSWFEFFAEGSATLVVFGSLLVVALRAVKGLITLGDTVAFYQALLRGVQAVRNIVTELAQLHESNLFLSHLEEFLEIEPKSPPCAQTRSVLPKMIHSITLKDVSFAYPRSNRLVLEQISFSIEPGELIVVVGENGAGKTTMAKLLGRLYEPGDGSVCINGIDYRDFDPEEVKKMIAYLPQDLAKYEVSITENVWYGDIDRPRREDEIDRALEFAGLLESVNALPQKKETILGSLFANGINLSEGQWRRLALARANFRKAEFVIMDEPLAAIDALTEASLIEQVKAMANEKAVLLISHRFSLARQANKILVLKEGKLVETGTHQQLMELGGYYSLMYNRQAGFYN